MLNTDASAALRLKAPGPILSDVVEALGKAQGGHYPLVKANSNDGKKWLSMPWAIIGGMIAYRKSWVDEVGATTFPDTWEKYREVGKLLKAKGRPIGQTLGHTFGDAPVFSYPFLWSWGGKEVGGDSARRSASKAKAPSISSSSWPASGRMHTTRAGSLGTSSNNNRAFLSQTISATLNGASIDIELLRNPDKYISEKGAQLKTDILHAPLPSGPAGQFSMHTYHSHVMPAYSKHSEGGQGIRIGRRIPGLFTRSGSSRRRASPRRRLPIGRSTRCGTKTRS